MRINRSTITLLSIVILLIAGSSCQTVKPYQRAYLNDANMQMGFGKNAAFENYAQFIREGASGAGGKSGGGCGCN